jgi:hypothetical protein
LVFLLAFTCAACLTQVASLIGAVSTLPNTTP